MRGDFIVTPAGQNRSLAGGGRASLLHRPRQGGFGQDSPLKGDTFFLVGKFRISGGWGESPVRPAGSEHPRREGTAGAPRERSLSHSLPAFGGLGVSPISPRGADATLGFSMVSRKA